ncbi:cysteine proteinase, partial [Aspergillus sclerotioniger CBS 115572]
LTPAWAPIFINHCTREPRGFHNPKFLCYRNSAILLFLYSPLFLNWLERYNRTHVNCDSESKCLTCGLHELGLAYWSTDPIEDALVPVWERLRETSWNYVDEQDQQDVREFMDKLLEGLFSEIDEEGRHELNQIFKIEISNDRVCLKCYQAMPMQPDQRFFLAADFKPERSPGHDKIHKLLNTPSHSMINCGKCKKETKHLLCEKITYLPEIFFVQVNRAFISNGVLQRNNDPVKLADQLTIPPEMLDGMVNSAGGNHYELYGIIFHRSCVSYQGHYTCAVKRPKGDWAWVDDDKNRWVGLKTVHQVLHDEREDWRTSVYILAYRRLALDRPLELGRQPVANDDETGKSGPCHTPTGDSPRGSLSNLDKDSAKRSSPDDVRLDQTIRLTGRKLKWTVEEPVVIPEGCGPLIQIRRGRRVQYAELRLTLTCEATDEILTGKGRISLKPNTTRKIERTPSPAAVMDTRDIGTQTSPGTGLKKAGKPRGITKDKAASR